MASEIKEQNLRLNAQLNISETGGAKVSQSYQNVADSLQQIATKARPAQTWLDNLGNTVLNTFRYQIVNKFTDALLSGAQEITSYLKDVDKELNNIRIVSGQTQAQVESFLSTAQSGAKALGKTTTDYLEAAQQYYQQGLSTNEVISRTEATLKAANITGQSISDTVQQTTAVLNGFNISSKDINKTLSVMASLGAATASDFEELSTASQKVASVASTAGIPLNNTMAMITTIASVTRESAESVGTSLNAMIGRFNKLSVDEKQQVSSTIETTLKNTKSGVSMFDQTTGQVRNLNAVLTDLAGVWKTLDKNSQEAILTQLAGTRQANRLASLMNNWDEYQKNLKIAEMAEDSLDAQNQVYMQSLEALDNQMKTASMTMWGNLFNTEMLKDWDKGWTNFYTITGNIIKNIGGLPPILSQLGIALLPILNKLATPIITNLAVKSINTKTTTEGMPIAKTQEGINSLGGVYSDVKLLNDNQLSKLSEGQVTAYNKAVKALSEQVTLKAKLQELEETQKSYNLNDINAAVKKNELIEKELEAEKQKAALKAQIEKSQKNDIAAAKATIKANNDAYNATVKTEAIKNFPELFKGKTNASKLSKESREIIDFADDTSSKRSVSSFVDQYDLSSKEKEQLVKEIKNYRAALKAAAKVQEDANSKVKETSAETETLKATLKTLEKNFNNKQNVNSKDFTSLLAAGGDSKNIIAQKFNASNAVSLGTLGANETSFSRLETIINKIADGRDLASVLDEFGIKQKDLNGAYSVLLDKTKEVILENGENVKGATEDFKEGNLKNQPEAERLLAMDKAKKRTNTLTAIAATVAGVTTLTSALGSMAEVGATGTQKVQAGIQAVGSSLAAATAMIPDVGFVVSGVISLITTGLQYFAEATQLGADDAEKMLNRITAAKKSIEKITQPLAEERDALSSVSIAADDLAKKYQAQKFTYDQLSESEKTNYDQVAEYVEKYAPQLILYYDKEGKAILNLNQLYSNSSKTNRNALDEKYLSDAYNVYSSNDIQKQVAANSAALLGTYQNATSAIADYKEKISKAISLGDIKNLDTLNDKLAEQEQILTTLNSDWDEIVSKPITYGDKSFQSLNDSGQTLIKNLSSFNNFSSLGIGQDEGSISAYTGEIETLSSSLATLGDQANNFLGMDQQLQIDAANIAISYGFTNDQLQKYISGLTEASFLQGTWMDQVEEFASSNYDKKISSLNEQISALDEKMAANSEQEKSEAAMSGIVTSTGDLERQQKLEKEANDETVREHQRLTDAKARAVRDQANLDKELLRVYESDARQYANSSNEAYNKVLDSFNEMQSEMVDSNDNTKANLQKKSGRLYAILKGDDADYYDHWLSINEAEIGDEAEKTGILASNYSTYNEYMSAVDAEYAKAKTIIANTTGKSILETEQAVTNEKYKNLAVQLRNEGNNASAETIIAGSVSDNKILKDNAATTAQLEGLRQTLLARKAHGEQVLISTDGVYKQLGNLYNNSMSAIGADVVGFANTGTEQVSIDEALKSIDKAEAAINKKTKETEANGSLTQEQQDEINAAIAGFQNYADLVKGSTGTESDFNYDTTDFGALAYKDTGGDEPINTTPADGSGSDKTKKNKLTSLKDIKEGKTYDETIDKLKRYDEEITQVEHDLDILSAKKDHLYGDAYLDNLKKEIDLQQQDLELSKQRLAAAKTIGAQAKTDLETQAKAHNLALAYSSTGSISNYNDIIQAMEDASKGYQNGIDTKTAQVTALTAQYNAMKAAYDDASDNDAKNSELNASADEINALADQINAATEEVNTAVANQSTYNDWAKSFKESMDNYEKYAVDEVQKTEKDIQDKISKVLTDKVEAISYPVTIVVEAADQNSKYIELLSAIAKNKGKVTFSVDTTTNFDKLQSTIKEINALMAPNVTGGLNDLLSQTQNLLGQVKDTDLASAPKDLLDAIRKQEETMISTASNLQSIISSMKDAFQTGVDSAVSTLNDALDKFSVTTTAYDNLVNAAQKTNADTFDFLTSASKASLDISNKQIVQLQEQANAIKATRDGFAKGTDEYLKADQTYIQQMNKIASLQQTAAENINKTITNLISRNNKDLESIFLGGQTAANIKQTLSDLNEARKKYLAQERRIYETTKLEEDIAADIEKHQDNTAIQKRLKDFQQAELKYLNSKDKLTQSDLDLSQKQYELLKAQIALEEAQEGKEYTRMLQRNSSGNYGYVSVADTSKIDAAKEAYQKSIDDLYQYASGQYDSYLNNLSTAVSDYETKTNKIITEYQAGNITKEKAEELYQQAQEALKAQYKEAQDGMKTMAAQMSGTTELQKLASDKLSTLTTQASTLDKLIQGNAEGFDDLYKEMTGKSVDDTIFSDLNNTAIDLTKNWKELFSVLGTDLSTVDFSKLDTNINTILNSIDDYNKLLKDWSNTAANTVNSIISTDLINQINTNASEINAAASKELESVANTTKAYEAQRAAIEESNASIMDMINALDAASAKIESTFGVTNGTVDTSNLTSGIANTDISSAIIPTTVSGSDSAALFAKAAQSAGATVTTSQDQYHVEMEFPNVTDKDEIIKAFEGINNYVDQYLANNKNS